MTSQVSPHEAIPGQLDAKVACLKEIHSHSRTKENELTSLHGEETKLTVVLPRWLTQAANDTSVVAEQGSILKESEPPVKLAKVVCGVEGSLNVPLTVTYTALLSKRDKLKNCCEALVSGDQKLPVLAKKTKELLAKVVGFEKSNVSAKAAPAIKRKVKLTTAADKQVFTFSVELKGVHAAQKQSEKDTRRIQ